MLIPAGRASRAGACRFPAASPCAPANNIPSAELTVTRHQSRVQAHSPVRSSPRPRPRDGTGGASASPRASHPAVTGNARRGWGQAIEHGPGTTAQLTSVDLQSGSSLNACDLASHGEKGVFGTAGVEPCLRAGAGICRPRRSHRSVCVRLQLNDRRMGVKIVAGSLRRGSPRGSCRSVASEACCRLVRLGLHSGRPGMPRSPGRSSGVRPMRVATRKLASDWYRYRPRGLGASRPSSRARCTACARVWTPSLLYMCRVWVLIVLTDTNNSEAISGAGRLVGR